MNINEQIEDIVRRQLKEQNEWMLDNFHGAPPPPPPNGRNGNGNDHLPPMMEPLIQGHGAQALGGRGRPIRNVTHIGKDGEGSLNRALQTDGGTIIFRVGGGWDDFHTISVRNDFFTVAGQTAPGSGVTLGGRIKARGNQTIYQYLRFRNENTVQSAIRATNAKDVVLDHISASGYRDDMLDIYAHGGKPESHRATIQHCLLAEAWKGHPTAMLVGGHTDPEIASWGSFRNHDVSIHRNLYVHAGHRNPNIAVDGGEVINNVVHNWGSKAIITGNGGKVDFINNVWQAGSMSRRTRVIAFGWLKKEGGIIYEFPDSSIYIAGNIVTNKGLVTGDEDNWPLLYTSEGHLGFPKGPVDTKYRRTSPLTPALIPVTILHGLDVASAVYADVGCNRRLAPDGSWIDITDDPDRSFIADSQAGTGPSKMRTGITKGIYQSGQPYEDTMSDGMADEWERLVGLNPNVDNHLVRDSTGEYALYRFLNGEMPVW